MNKFKAGIITVSDRCSKGICEDKSGPEIKRILEENGYEICALKIVSDDIDEIKAALLDMYGAYHNNRRYGTVAAGQHS